MKPNKICIIEINENIRRVRMDMPLTRSLRELNTNCEFSKKFEDMFGRCAEGSVMKPFLKFKKFKCLICGKEFETRRSFKKYCSYECYKIKSLGWQRKYQQTEKYKEYQRKYQRKKNKTKLENYRVK